MPDKISLVEVKDFNLFSQALRQGFWLNELCILSYKRNKGKTLEPIDNWVSRETTDSRVIIWNEETDKLSEKAVYHNNGEFFIKSEGKRYYLKDFKQGRKLNK